MNIIDMPGEVVFVANGVLPKPPLPKREIAIRIARQPSSLIDQRATEMPFDPPPAPRKIRIFRRQCEDGMQVIGRITIASTAKGRSRRATRKASRNLPT